MHQRRHRSPSVEASAVVIAELLHGWRTIRELEAATGIKGSWVGQVVRRISESRYIFKRHRDTPRAMVAEYRIFPEAIQVRRR